MSSPLDKSLRPLCNTYIVGDILDQMLLGRLVVEHEIATIFHLASILSTKAEYNPETAHRINVEGTLNLLRLGRGTIPMAGGTGQIHLPQFDRRLWHPHPGTEAKSGRG